MWGKIGASRATSFLIWRVGMENQAVGNSSTKAASSGTSTAQRDGRGVWVLTAYGISGLALFGVLLYYFSTYVTR